MEVDQEVRLHQDLIVHTLDIVIGMMVGHQVADAVHVGLGQLELRQQVPGVGRALLLLQGAGAPAILGLAGADGDVVDQGGALQHQLGVGVQPLSPADELGKPVHL